MTRPRRQAAAIPVARGDARVLVRPWVRDIFSIDHNYAYFNIQ